jgi:hypothetical protein
MSDQSDNNSNDKPQTPDPEPGLTKEEVQLIRLIVGPPPGKEDEYKELFAAQSEEKKRAIRAAREKIMSELPSWGQKG